MQHSLVDSVEKSVGDIRIQPREYEQITRFAHETFGLDLKPGKEELVIARLSRKIRQGNFSSVGAYFEHVMADASGASKADLIDMLTTNHTSFLREPAHFDYMTQALARDFASTSNLRVWSAACSTGEEPCTIACCLTAAGRSPNTWEIRATDISNRVLAQARKGLYREETIAPLPDAWKRQCFLKGQGRSAGWYRVRPEIQARIRFERINLIEMPPAPASYHFIFCRNVMIYFDKDTQQHLVGRLAAALEPGGYLLVGHSESLSGMTQGLAYVQPATYRKAGTAGGRK